MDKWRGVGRLVVACAVVVGMLAACTPEGGPVVTETPSVSGSPGGVSPSPSPTASVDVLAALPDAARTNDLDGAVATAEFFVEEIQAIFITQDLNAWKALSTPNCEYCSSQALNVEDLAASDFVATGGEVAIIREATIASGGANGTAAVTLTADIGDLFLVDAAGERSLAEAASETSFALDMVWADDAWRVNGVALDF